MKLEGDLVLESYVTSVQLKRKCRWAGVGGKGCNREREAEGKRFTSRRVNSRLGQLKGMQRGNAEPNALHIIKQ